MVPLHSNRRIAALEVYYLGMLWLLGSPPLFDYAPDGFAYS